MPRAKFDKFAGSSDKYDGFAVGAPSVAPIDPYSLSSLIIGYDWRRQDLIVSSGGLISSIADTESARAMVQATDASKPSRDAAAGFVFDGGADTVAYAGDGYPSLTAPFHLFCILAENPLVDANTRYAFGYGGNGTNFALHLASTPVGGGRRAYARAGTGAMSTGPVDTYANLADGSMHLVEVWGESGIVTVKVDDYPEVAAPVAYSITATGRIRASGRVITSPAATELWHGSIKLAHVHDAVLTGATLAGVRQSLKNARAEVSP